MGFVSTSVWFENAQLFLKRQGFFCPGFDAMYWIQIREVFAQEDTENGCWEKGIFIKKQLVGGFKHFLFSPLLVEDSNFD